MQCPILLKENNIAATDNAYKTFPQIFLKAVTCSIIIIKDTKIDIIDGNNVNIINKIVDIIN